jgi:hypothetical protein
MTPDDLDLDACLDAIFAAPADGFVAAREALVRELKQAGRRDDAATVHALRRPTVAVWSLNQMARAQPDQLAALVAAGDEVDELQQCGADARDDLRAAARRRRALLDGLTEVAAAFADRPDGVRASVAATLDAAALDPSLQDDLLRGRLTAELAPAVRFLGDVGDTGDAPRPPRPARPARATKRAAPAPPPRDDLAARRAATALAEARERAEVVADEMREAETDSRDAQQRVDDAHRRVAELESALADARAEVADAKRAVTEASRAETRVRTAQRRAEAALRVAERNAQDAGA